MPPLVLILTGQLFGPAHAGLLGKHPLGQPNSPCSAALVAEPARVGVRSGKFFLEIANRVDRPDRSRTSNHPLELVIKQTRRWPFGPTRHDRNWLNPVALHEGVTAAPQVVWQLVETDRGIAIVYLADSGYHRLVLEETMADLKALSFDHQTEAVAAVLVSSQISMAPEINWLGETIRPGYYAGIIPSLYVFYRSGELLVRSWQNGNRTDRRISSLPPDFTWDTALVTTVSVSPGRTLTLVASDNTFYAFSSAGPISSFGGQYTVPSRITGFSLFGESGLGVSREGGFRVFDTSQHRLREIKP